MSEKIYMNESRMEAVVTAAKKAFEEGTAVSGGKCRVVETGWDLHIWNPDVSTLSIDLRFEFEKKDDD